MKYKITHTTTYRYSTPVSVCHNALMLCPGESPRTQCHSCRISIRPQPVITERRHDVFGNVVHRFSLEENHSVLTITATSHVTAHEYTIPKSEQHLSYGELLNVLDTAADPNWLEVMTFRFDSPRIRRSQKFADYAAAFFPPDRSVVEAVKQFTAKMFSDFRYDKSATDVDTPAETSFQEKHGVCQDFAHVAVACLRSLRIPARYVSGYLRTVPPPGKKRLVGADQSHAWVSAYCGPAAGWVDFDPTNNCICNTDHIPIAIGRDYGDVVPIKGVFLGGGEPQLTVSVDVEPEV